MRENGDCILHEIPLKWDSDVFGDSGGRFPLVVGKGSAERRFSSGGGDDRQSVAVR